MTTSDIPILVPPAELTAATDTAFEALAAPHLEASAPGLVIDLSAVSLVTSAGLGRLVHLGRALHERGGKLALAGGSRTVTRLLRTVGLDAVMPHFPTAEGAVQYIRGQPRV